MRTMRTTAASAFLPAGILSVLGGCGEPQSGRPAVPATFEEPHRYSTGVVHVFVNGEQVLKDGEHTGAMPGRVVRGPGWKPSQGGN
jgi:hypothetical protein